MKELVNIGNNDTLITELKTVADHFGKRTQDLQRTIKKLIATDNTLTSEFIETTYVDSTGRTLPTYYLTQEGFALLVMGFTGKEALKWKRAFYKAFEEMRLQLTECKISLSEEKHKKQIEKLEHKLHLLHYENKADLLGERLYTVTEIGKMVGMSAIRLNKTLEKMGIQRRIDGVWVVMDELKVCGFIRTTSYEHESGVNILTKWTESGKNFITKLLNI